MSVFKKIISNGWFPILITGLAIAGFVLEWPIAVLIPGLVVILAIGLMLIAVDTKEKEMQLTILRFKELAGYFNRRFAGNSSLSIFSIIDGLYSVESTKLWDWARACDMAQRIFVTWCSGFVGRIETDIRVRGFNFYLRTYLNELWLINSHYNEFIEQFCEIARKMELPTETLEQYNRFTMEYNAFIRDFRDTVGELRKTAKTEIEPASVKFAEELSVGRGGLTRKQATE